MKLTKKICGIIFLSILILAPIAVSAAGNVLSLVDNGADAYTNGNYQLSDAMLLVIRVSKIILQSLGVITFAMFIYGGFMFLISAGNPKTVTQAKGILVAAVVGLIIVFVSYLLVQFFINSITGATLSHL